MWPFLHLSVCAQLLQSCPTLCSPLDCSPPAPLSMGFSRQECWSRLLCPSPGELPDPGVEPMAPVAPALQADSLPLSHQGSPLTSFEIKIRPLARCGVAVGKGRDRHLATLISLFSAPTPSPPWPQISLLLNYKAIVPMHVNESKQF